MNTCERRQGCARGAVWTTKRVRHANGGAAVEYGRLLLSILSAGEHYNTQAVKAYEKTVPLPVGAGIARLVG
jgi:hypothetical protein